MYLDLDLATTSWDEFGMAARLAAQTNESEPGPTIAYGDTDSDGWPDQAALVWAESYPEVTVWVFRTLPGAVIHVETYTSVTSTITIFGIAGEFLISASATENGSAVSQSTLSLTLFGASTFEVQLMRDGAAVSDGYDVRVVSTDLIDYAEMSNGKFYIRLTVPTQASVGQLVRIEVLNEDGEIVSSAHAFVPDDYATLDIDLVANRAEAQTDSSVLLLFSVLPGLFVLAFALMMYVDFRKKLRAS